MNIPYDFWWSICLNSLGQQLLLGFFFPSYSVLLAYQIGNVLLLNQNIFYINIRCVRIRFLLRVQQNMYAQIRQVFFIPSPLRILTRVISLKQVIDDFGQTAPFTSVGTLWLILMMYTLSVFVLLIAILHPTFILSLFVIRVEGGNLFFWLNFLKIFQVLANAPQTEKISKKKSRLLIW